MTTSGITSWPLTAQEIVTQACYELGAIPQGDVPSGDEMEDGILRLNAMLRSLPDTMFRETSGEVLVAGGSSSTLLAEGIRNVSSVRHVVSDTYSRQLAEWNRAEFYMMPNRTTAGNPSVYYAQKTTAGIQLFVWPTPADDFTLHLDYSAVPQTVTDPSETVDVPEEWQEAIIFGLASRMAGIFGATRTDPGTVGRIDQKAAILLGTLLDRDRPDSYYFEPDV